MIKVTKKTKLSRSLSALIMCLIISNCGGEKTPESESSIEVSTPESDNPVEVFTVSTLSDERGTLSTLSSNATRIGQNSQYWEVSKGEPLNFRIAANDGYKVINATGCNGIFSTELEEDEYINGYSSEHSSHYFNIDSVDNDCQFEVNYEIRTFFSDLVFVDPSITNCISRYYGGNLKDSTYVDQINYLNCDGLSSLEGINQLFNLEKLVINDYSDALTLKNLNGISNMASLKHFIIDNADFTEVDMSALSTLPNLTSIEFINVKLPDTLSPLVQMPNLVSFTTFATESLDLSWLDAFINLRVLDISDSNWDDLTSLSNLINLTELSLGHNKISDLTPISNLINLTKLEFVYSGISDLTSLSALINLTELDLSSNEISDLTSLSALINLTELDLSSNEISDLTSLSALINLTELDLSSNEISDLTSLSNLINLTELDLSHNEISDLTILFNLKSLSNLALNGNSQLSCNQINELKENLPKTTLEFDCSD